MNEANGTQETRSTTETEEMKAIIKDERDGRTIYIPDEIFGEMEDIYLESQLRLRKGGQGEFKKNSHFTCYSYISGLRRSLRWMLGKFTRCFSTLITGSSGQNEEQTAVLNRY